jgi:hypothetical protein
MIAFFDEKNDKKQLIVAKIVEDIYKIIDRINNYC